MCILRKPGAGKCGRRGTPGGDRRGRGRAGLNPHPRWELRDGGSGPCCASTLAAGAWARLLTAGNEIPAPALTTRSLRDNVCLNFCEDLVRPNKTRKMCRKSPTHRHEADQALELRGARWSRARPGCPASKAKQAEERPAGRCRGRTAAPIPGAGEPRCGCSRRGRPQQPAPSGLLLAGWDREERRFYKTTV